MKKFMRIALVFALAGAALVGCTKDYSGDISDLNKKVSEQQSAVTALQNAVSNAQTAADNALANAQNALKEAQEAAKAAAAANNDEEVAALTAKVATIEGEIAGLEAKVKALDGLEAKLNEVAEQLKKDVDAKVDAALEEVRAELEEALAQIDGLVSIEAPSASIIVNYDYATFNLPDDLTAEPYKSLVAAFPEVKAFKGNQITQGGHVPFTVNPESTEFDETFTYEFVGLDGKTFGTLSDPVEGFVGVSSANAGAIQTKSANGFWTLSFAPTMKKNNTNKLVVAEAAKEPLSLVITKGDTRAATTFAYKAAGADVTETALDVVYASQNVIYAESIDLLNTKYYKDGEVKTGKLFNMVNALSGKFIFSAAAGNENALDIEKYGVEFGKPGESTIKVTKFPEDRQVIEFKINVAYIGLNGRAYDENFKLTVTNAISTDGVLAAKEVTLDGKKDAYPVRWNLADYDFTKAQLKALVEASSKKLSFTYVDPETGKVKSAPTQDIEFYKKDGKTTTNTWSEAVSFGFNLAPATYWPDEYTVTLRIFNGEAGTPSDITVYAAKSTITVANDADVVKGAVKLLDAVCDEDGTLLAVGSADGTKVRYDFANAFVVVEDIAEITGYKDLEYDKYAGESVENYNWISKVNFGTEATPDYRPVLLQIPANGQKDAQEAKYNYVNNVKRHIRANVSYFGNSNNVGYVDFDVKVISPIYSESGAVEAENQTIFLGGDDETEFTYFEVSEVIKSAKYVAGDDVNKPYNVFKGWKHIGEVPKTFLHTYTASADNYSGTAVPEAQQHWGEGSNSVVDGTELMIDNNGDFIIIEKTGNILRGFGLSSNEVLAVQTATQPLYLTDRMGIHAGARWALYYDNYGKPRAAKLSNGEKVYAQAWAKYVNNGTQAEAQAQYENTINELTGKDEAFVKATIRGQKPAASDAEINEIYAKVCSEFIFNDDKNPVAAYNVLKPSFDKITTVEDPDAPASEDAKWVEDPDVKVADEIANVKIGFKDPVTAKTFIKSVNEITDAYLSSHSCKVEVNPNAVFKAGMKSVDVPAYIKISDKWGMTMTLPFTVTVKVASK